MVEWTPKLIAKLQVLWMAGKPASQIAVELQTTRYAVIGKARRVGMEARPSPIIRTGVIKPRPSRASKPACSKKLAPVALPTGSAVTHMDGCMWPMWTDGRAPRPALWCGEVKVIGRSYCGHHAARAYVPCKPDYFPRVRLV